MFDYYKAPKQEIFDEIKEKAIKIWKTYDDTYGYASEKIARVKEMENIRDNCCCIIAMFDIKNQNKLFNLIENFEALEWINELKKELKKYA